MIDIKCFAKIVINHYNSSGEYISNKKLQKLLYYIQVWHFVYFTDNLFNDEILPEAWVHGPVYPSIYNEYKSHGYNPILINLTEESIDISLVKIGLNEERIELVNQVIKQYGSLTAFELEYLSHSEDPWNNARIGKSSHEPCDNKITKDSMLKYYSPLLED